MQLVNSCTEFDSYPDSKSIERSVPFLASGRIVVGWLEAFGSLLQARISDWLMATCFPNLFRPRIGCAILVHENQLGAGLLIPSEPMREEGDDGVP